MRFNVNRLGVSVGYLLDTSSDSFYWIVAHLAPDPLLMLKQLIAFYSINIGQAIGIDYKPSPYNSDLSRHSHISKSTSSPSLA